MWKERRLLGSSVREDLQSLYPGEDPKEKAAVYLRSKVKISLLTLTVCLMFGAAAQWSQNRSSQLDPSGSVARDEVGGNQKEVVLRTVNPRTEEEEEFRITVFPRELTEEEFTAAYESFRDNIEAMIKGENTDLEHVRKDLSLLENYEGYPFTVQWESSRPDLIKEDGTLQPGEGDITLYADISCGTYSGKLDVAVHAAAAELTGSFFREQTEEELLISERNTRDQEQWQLPGEIAGLPVAWTEKTVRYGLISLPVAIAAAVLIFFFSDRDLHQKTLLYRQQMIKEYPLIVHKLLLYVGAGMSVRNAFEILGEEIEVKEEHSGKSGPGYREVLRLRRLLHTGTAETAAYEQLGRQTGVREYIGLGTLLSQNNKRGNAILLERLREEIDKTNHDAVLRHRRIGEEAGTKLLLPTVLLLTVTLIMIMVPAMSSI